MYLNILNHRQQALLPLLEAVSSDFMLVGGTAIALQLGHRRSVDFDLISSRAIGHRRIRNLLADGNFRVEATLRDNSDELTQLINGAKVTFLRYPFKITRQVLLQAELPNGPPDQLKAEPKAKLHTNGRTTSPARSPDEPFEEPSDERYDKSLDELLDEPSVETPARPPTGRRDIIWMPDLVQLGAMKAYALGRRAKWRDYVDLYYLLSGPVKLTEMIRTARELFGGGFNEKLFRAQLVYFEDVDTFEVVDLMADEVPSNQEIMKGLVEIATG